MQFIIFGVLIKYILPTFHCHCQPSYKISSKYLNPWLNYNHFFKFKMAAVCYLGFYLTWFWAIGRLGLCFSIIVSNLVQKCCSMPNYGPKSKSKMAAVRHLGFSKIWFLTTGTPWATDFPSLYQIWRKKNVDWCQNYGPESKSKMAAVRNLGFVTSSFRTTHEVFSLGHIGLWNFMLIQCIVLKMWRFEFFCRFGLKCLFACPKFWFLGGLNP